MARSLSAGSIPAGWKYDLLDKFAVRCSGHTPSKSFPEYWNGGIKWISLADSYRLDKGYVYETDNEISEAGIKNSSAELHPADTVVISRDAGIGKSGVMAVPMAVSQHFIAWRCDNKAKLNSWFLYNWLQLNKAEFERQAVGSTIKTIGLPYFKKLKIAVPPYAEQKKIAKILSTWDKAITTTEQLLANSQQQKKALMQQLLTGKKRLLDNNGVRFSGEWKKVKVRDLIIQHSEKTDRNNQYPVLTSSRQGMLFQKDYYNGRDVASEDTTGYNVVPFGYFTYRHMSDDLIFSFNINELCEKGIVSTLYPVFKAKEEEITPYLLRLILNKGREFKQFSLEQKQGGSRTYMYLSKLQELKLNIPSLEEQQKIVAVLFSAAKEISALQQKLEALKQEKKALMQQLLTGKRRVQVPKEEVAC